MTTRSLKRQDGYRRISWSPRKTRPKRAPSNEEAMARRRAQQRVWHLAFTQQRKGGKMLRREEVPTLTIVAPMVHRNRNVSPYSVFSLLPCAVSLFALPSSVWLVLHRFVSTRYNSALLLPAWIQHSVFLMLAIYARPTRSSCVVMSRSDLGALPMQCQSHYRVPIAQRIDSSHVMN
uniref:Uncharacterized protein n=1 Tax=Craspedostauros australis TaxID=1486917 RepID=A0A7R9ZPU4_9STRA|mmetsp:Transcript_5058/g.13498  ORF Transcript_5058/g.13498 Transcript_5058/m.13498 type:complete len:177 (+) Transcript_5058:58-588(+)